MPTYRLDVEYEGTRYHGWQEQKNARAVAGELRAALERAGAEVSELVGSGRTDAGVHALRQTAHLRLRRERPSQVLMAAANESLPHDIQILGLWPARPSFHARHDAMARSYVYQLSRRRAALGKRWIWWIKADLDLARLREAAARIEGRHDFRLLCERPTEQSSTVVVVERVEVVEQGDLILLRFVASHFLWKMVRRLVGLLARIGSGELDASFLAALLEPPRENAVESAAPYTAPPSGLFLERVVYPGEAGIAALTAVMPVARAWEPAGAPFLGSDAPSRAAAGSRTPRRRARERDRSSRRAARGSDGR